MLALKRPAANLTIKPSNSNQFLYLQVQHTPNPLAQDPAAVPPLLEHSELSRLNNKKFTTKK